MDDMCESDLLYVVNHNIKASAETIKINCEDRDID